MLRDFLRNLGYMTVIVVGLLAFIGLGAGIAFFFTWLATVVTAWGAYAIFVACVIVSVSGWITITERRKS